MIIFSNGHELDFACGSGALGFDGRGWPWEKPLIWTQIIAPHELTVVAKTVTYMPRPGNLSLWHPWTSVMPFDGGIVNAVGLTNGGYKWWVEKAFPKSQKYGYKIAASIQGDSPDEVGQMSRLLAPLSLAYIEINISCPNVDHKEDMTRAKLMLDQLRNSNDHPTVVKISYAQSGDEEMLKMLDEHPKVEAVHAINTIPFELLYPGGQSPVKYNGNSGVSGHQIFQFALKAISNIRDKTRVPIIAGGGICSLDDILMMEGEGANAFSIGTLFLKSPWKPKRIIRDYREYKRKQAESHREVLV